MFEDLIQELVLETGSLSDYLDELYETDSEIIRKENEISTAKEGILTKKNKVRSDYILRVKERVKFEIDFEGILASRIEEAVTSSEEYGNRLLFPGISSLPLDSSVYTVVESGAGFQARINVIFNLDPIAGSLDDYSRGVEKHREVIGAKSKNPKRSSAVWESRVYKNPDPTRYIVAQLNKTEFSGKIAAYWRLLDEGSTTTMNSAFGGSPYPIGIGTDFTGKASLEVTKLFRSGMKSEEEVTNRIKENVILFEYEITEIKRKLSRRVDDVVGAIDTHKVRQLVQKYGDDLDKDRIAKYLNRIITGQEIATLSRGRVQLGKPGKGIRRKIETFVREVQ